MIYKIFILSCLFFSGVTFGGSKLDSGTVVGNGGDPIFEFFEASRAILIKILNNVREDPKKQELLCQLEALSSDQIVFCRHFVLEVLPEILKLSQGPNKTLFALREDPLKVIGPDGEPMMVAARTELGPGGPIELHRDSVKNFVPTQALFLIAHEFLHKSAFEGIYISDNGPIGPFDNGRDLLDSASKYLVDLAVKTGVVGTQFGVQDIFKCDTTVGTTPIGTIVSSNRMYFSKDLDSYESSLGKNPTDNTIFVPETNNSSIILRAEIVEPNNCREPSSSRKTLLKVIRVIALADQTSQFEVLKENDLLENPMCSNASPNFEISWEQIRFSCKYIGSIGTTRSPYSFGHFGYRLGK